MQKKTKTKSKDKNRNQDIRKKNRKVTVMITVVVLLLVALILGVIIAVTKNEKKYNEERYRLGDGVVIEEASKYTGEFWEDGSDKKVKGVWALTVTNISDEDIQYMTILADNAGKTAEFEITALPAGSTVQVLEKSAEKYPDNEKDCTYQFDKMARFTEQRSLHKDVFTISSADNWIKVKNHSDQNVENTVYVYYKNEEDGVFQGGITYRLKIAGGIQAGQSREQQTKHFDPEKSRIMYVTYQ